MTSTRAAQRRNSSAWNAMVNAVGGAHLLPPAKRRALYQACGIEIGEDTRMYAGQVFRPGRFSIGKNCFFNYGCSFDPGDAGITIEDGVSAATGVVFAAAGHEFGPSELRRGPNVSVPIRVERGAAIGARAVILPGVTIGAGCFIGAGSVVTKDTKPDSVYTGAPARWARDL